MDCEHLCVSLEDVAEGRTICPDCGDNLIIKKDSDILMDRYKAVCSISMGRMEAILKRPMTTIEKCLYRHAFIGGILEKKHEYEALRAEGDGREQKP